jgi:hypothetical protein
MNRSCPCGFANIDSRRVQCTNTSQHSESQLAVTGDVTTLRLLFVFFSVNERNRFIANGGYRKLLGKLA